jgi:small GTP-binding protein
MASEIPRIRVMVVGDTLVGKTSVILRYFENLSTSAPMLETVGVDFQRRVISLDGCTFMLEVWDTAGQDRFRAMAQNYFRRADGFGLLFDIARRSSFEHLDMWIQMVKDNANRQDVPMLLIGNKNDRVDEREVPADEGKAFADRNNMDYIETSAKTGFGVAQAFEDLSRAVISATPLKQDNGTDIGADPTRPKTEGGKLCC